MTRKRKPFSPFDEPPRTEPSHGSSNQKRCDCGAPLLSSGLCADTGLYPASAPCPFACPVCRGPLTWRGMCHRCHGSLTPFTADTWHAQDRYEEDSARHHQVKVCGPQRLPTTEESRAATAILQRVLAGKITSEVGLKELDAVFGTVDGVLPEGDLAASPW